MVRTTGSVAVGSAARSCERRSASASCRSSELPCGDIAINAVHSASIGCERIEKQLEPCQYRICVERLLRERQCSRQLRVLIGLLSPSNPKLTSGSEHRSCRLHQRARVHAAHGHTRKHAQTHAHARMHNSLLEKTQAPPNRNQCSERISPTLPQDQSQQ